MPPISDADYAALLASEVPAPSDPVIKQFLAARDALRAEELKQRSDHSFRQSLSPIARRAHAIVARIRDEERRTIWTPELDETLAITAGGEGGSGGMTVYPGMAFSLAKGLMEGTRLWGIVRRLPKGGLLHAHLDAMVDVDYLLEEVMRAKGMCVASLEGRMDGEEARRKADVQVKFRADGGVTDEAAGGLWTGGYKVGGWVPVGEAAEKFPEGGREGFLKWLKSRCVLSRTDAVEQHHGPDAIWKKFIGCFGVLGSFLHYEPIWRAFLRRLMTLLVEDGVSWVEIRFAWLLDYCREGSDVPEQDYDHMFTVLSEELDRFRATPEGASFWGIRMIWTSVRSEPTRSIIQNMDDCIATKLSHPTLLSGYDLVGLEDGGRPLSSLLPELFWFRKQCALEGVTLPLFLHAGETLGDGTHADGNLYDAVLLGTRRIGHGLSLYKHPRLVEAVRDRRVLVESCPISNEILRFTGSIMHHPLPALLARGVACALCNDDPAILGQDTAGMTHDFWQALQGWENLGLAGLGSLAENSVRWAAFEDQTAEEWTKDIKEASMGSGIKAKRLQEWAVAWERFCLWIVTEYGEEYGDEEEEGGAST